MTPPDACPICGTTGRKRKCCRPANQSSKLQQPSHTGASDNLKGDKRAESVNLEGDEARDAAREKLARLIRNNCPNATCPINEVASDLDYYVDLGKADGIKIGWDAAVEWMRGKK